MATGPAPEQPDKVVRQFAQGDGELTVGDDTRFYARGGSWWKELDMSRSAARPPIAKDARFDNVGVRVARRLSRE